jgi:hypothetical protein
MTTIKIEFFKEFFQLLFGRPELLTITPEVPAADERSLIQSIDELIDSQPIPIAPPPPPIKIYAANLDLEKHKPVYTLSPSQANKLYYAVNIGGVAWNVPQPKDDDPQELKDGLDVLNVEFEDLVALGLAKDVSDRLQDKIDHMRKTHGRNLRYFAPTQTAFQLFSQSEKREDN